MLRQQACRLGAIGLVVVSAGCTTAFDPQSWDRFLLRPAPPPKRSPADVGLSFEDVRFPTADGKRLAAWFVPAQNGKPRGTVLMHTGMAGNIALYLPRLAWITQSDFNALVYDWEGFGASEGRADFRNFEPDVNGAMAYLRGRPEPSCQRVIQAGLSMGTLAAYPAAVQHADVTVGMILYSPFFPSQIAPFLAEEHGLPSLRTAAWFAGHVWDMLLPPYLQPRNFIVDVHVPILVITPVDDRLVPPEAQRLIYAALPEPKEQYFTYGGHIDAPETDPGQAEKVVTWGRQLPGLLPE